MARSGRQGRRRRALAAASLLASGCAEPTVDALAVWLEGKTSRFQVYDAGDRRTMPFETAVADSDPSKMQIEVMRGGHGFVALPPNDTMVWIDPREGGYAEVGYDPLWGKLAAKIEQLDSGLAVTRWNRDDTGMVILPTVRGSAGPIWFPRPDPFFTPDGTALQFGLHSARNAPILYAWAGQPAFPNVVVVYELHDGSRGAAGLFERERIELQWRQPQNSADLITGSCTEAACISPSGDVLIAMEQVRTCDHPDITPCEPPPSACRVLRYQWGARPELGEQSITAMRLPADCDDFDAQRDGQPEILAALSGAVILLADTRRIYRANLDAGTWESIPKLGMAMSIYPAGEGGAALLVADNMQVIRADEHGLRIHSAEQLACGGTDVPVVSPSGEWVLTVCEAQSDVTTERSNKPPRTVVRISPFGLETYDGISMRALAIDDGGNALLYSFASGDSDQEPRGLFVLDAQGHLARIDSLEPAPLKLTGAMPYYFSAQAYPD